MSNPVVLARVDSIVPRSRDFKVSYSVLHERAQFPRVPREYECYVSSQEEIEKEIKRRHRIDLIEVVGDEEFNEYFLMFQEEDQVRGQRMVEENRKYEQRDEMEFYASLKGESLEIYQDLNLQGLTWKKASIAINNEFDRRYFPTQFVYRGITDGVNGLRGH